MKRTVENIAETKVKVTIIVDSHELADAEKVALVQLAKTVSVPGFRKGKVPASVVAKHVEPTVLQEKILDTAISKAVAEAFIGEDIQALERPQVEVTKYVPSDMLEFTAEAEILPKVTLGDYKKLSVKKAAVKAEDAEVDEVVERMRQGFAEKKPVERAAAMGDDVVIDFVGKKDGEPFDGGAAQDFRLTLGSGQFIPGFEEGVVGHTAGEEFDIDLAFPDDYHAEALAGQKVVFTVTLKAVEESLLPELSDELAKKAGPFETLQALRDDISREILANKEREAGEKYKDDLLDALVAKSEVIAPEVLIADHMRSIEQDFSQNLLYRGLTIENYLRTNNFKDEDDWREKEVKPAAERRVKASMVLNELSRAEKVTVTEEEIDAHVEQHKQQYAKNPQAAAQLSTPEARRDIANHFVLEKTIERLVELNTK